MLTCYHSTLTTHMFAPLITRVEFNRLCEFIPLIARLYLEEGIALSKIRSFLDVKNFLIGSFTKCDKLRL